MKLLKRITLIITILLLSLLFFSCGGSDGANSGGAEDPIVNVPGAETPNTENPGTETPVPEVPGPETPGAPGTDNPVTETPSTETTGTENPDPGISTYTITFDKNSEDATGSMNAFVLAAGETATLPECRFTRPGQVFLGWSESVDGDFAAFDTSSFTIGSGDKVLYAKWDVINSADEFDYEVKSDDTVLISGYIVDVDNPDFDTTLVLPETIEGKPVTEIYDFYNGYGASEVKITRLYFPANLKKITFKSEVHQNTALKNVIVDRRNTEFCSLDGVLYNNDKTRLYLVPAGRSDIAFTAPDSVVTIGEYAFINCKNLLSITLNGNINSIGRSAFQQCSGLTSISLPPLVNEVSNRLFADCVSLKSVSFEGDIFSIGSGAFSGCNFLEEITLPSTVNTIGASAFKECSSLTQIVIPDGVTVLERYTFDSCSALTNIILPASLKTISDYVFERCGSLKVLNLPVSLKSLSFWGMDRLYDIQAYTVAEGNQYYSSQDGVLFNKDKTILLLYPRGKKDLTTYIMPDSVTEIGQYAFSHANIENINFSSSLEIIGNQSFNYSRLTSVTIPDSVSDIKSDAFRGCQRLESVYLTRATPPALGSYAFANNHENRKIYVSLASLESYTIAANWSDYNDPEVMIGQ